MTTFPRQLNQYQSPPFDPQYANVGLLLGPYNLDTPNAAATTCKDYSANNHTMQMTVGATNFQINSGGGPFGSNSFRFTSDTGLRPNPATASPSLVFGVGDYTIEGWFLFENTPALLAGVQAYIVNGDGGGSYNTIWLVSTNTSGFSQYHVRSPTFNVQTMGFGPASTAPSSNVWTYVAVSRNSGQLRLFVGYEGQANCNVVGPTANASNLGVTSTFGIFSGSTGSLVAGSANPRRMSNIRVTKGVGRYSGSSLPVPTGPWPTK